MVLSQVLLVVCLLLCYKSYFDPNPKQHALICELRCSGNVNGTSDNLAPANYDAFVDYLTEVVQYYREEMNITFRTVEPFNEPSSTEWQLGNVQEGCHYNPLTQDSILQVCWPKSSHPVAYVTCLFKYSILYSFSCCPVNHPPLGSFACTFPCLLAPLKRN